VTSQLSAALRAAASGLHPDEAGTGLIISHDAFLHGDDFTRHVEISASISDGTPMAWIDWDAVITALDSGHLPRLRRRTAHRPRRGQPRRRPRWRQLPQRHPGQDGADRDRPGGGRGAPGPGWQLHPAGGT